MRPALLVLLALQFPVSAWSALTWESELVALDASPVDSQATGIFKFTNTGSTTVTITNIHASCGCTTPALDQKVYAPGESGDLRAVYAFGESTGRQEKTVTVSTDESGGGSYVLTLRVTIPALFEIQPRFVIWQQNEPATAKHITIRALHPELVRPTTLETRDSRFTAELQASADDPGLFTIAITPRDTTAAMFTSVVVQTSMPEGRTHVISVFATVR